MTEYTFINSQGHTVQVVAANIQMARQLAMVKVWGPYPHRYGYGPGAVYQDVGPYNGEGLLLRSERD
jgi:hypothetical protein